MTEPIVHPAVVTDGRPDVSPRMRGHGNQRQRRPWRDDGVKDIQGQEQRRTRPGGNGILLDEGDHRAGMRTHQKRRLRIRTAPIAASQRYSRFEIGFVAPGLPGPSDAHVSARRFDRRLASSARGWRAALRDELMPPMCRKSRRLPNSTIAAGIVVAAPIVTSVIPTVRRTDGLNLSAISKAIPAPRAARVPAMNPTSGIVRVLMRITPRLCKLMGTSSGPEP